MPPRFNDMQDAMTWEEMQTYLNANWDQIISDSDNGNIKALIVHVSAMGLLTTLSMPFLGQIRKEIKPMIRDHIDRLNLHIADYEKSKGSE